MSDLLTFVEKLPKLPTENPPLLILLHGYGSNELDLFFQRLFFKKEISVYLTIIFFCIGFLFHVILLCTLFTKFLN